MTVGNRKIKTAVSLVVSGAVVLGVMSVGFAQAPGTSDEELRNLTRQNRVAQIVYDLNLTEEQKKELKEIVAQIKTLRDAHRAVLADLLVERRDALLSGDDEAVASVEAELKALRQKSAEDVRAAVRAFTEGLTERQQVLLGRLIGVTWIESEHDVPMRPFLQRSGPTVERKSDPPWASERERRRVHEGRRVTVGERKDSPDPYGRIHGGISRGDGLMDRGHRIFMARPEAPMAVAPMFGSPYIDTLLQLLN